MIRPPPSRAGFALVWALLAMLVASALLAILWSQGEESRTRGVRLVLATRARLLARGALAHALHKVEKTVAYFDDRLKGGATSLDVGKQDPAYLEDLTGEVEYPGGKGTYRVVGMLVHRQETTRGEAVLKVSLVAEAAVEVGKDRRRERAEGDFRLFARGGGDE